jgi:SAM-dependent methyltransferase
MNLLQSPVSIVRRCAVRYGEWRDDSLDRKYGIDTRGAAMPAAASGGRASAPHGYHYEPIQLAVFNRIMRALPHDPAGLTFVDFGSGKGRALVLAALRGFRRVIGIEYDEDLHRIAQRNVARFVGRARLRVSIELRCADALSSPLPDEDCLCFLYNTFDEEGMVRAIAGIDASLRKRPRRLLIAYRNPRHSDALSAASFLRCLERNRSFELYEAATR